MCIAYLKYSKIRELFVHFKSYLLKFKRQYEHSLLSSCEN